VATVVVQPSAVVLHVGPVQVLILKNSVLCFNIYHPLMFSLISHWPVKIAKSSIDKEFHELRCLEVVLFELVHYLEWKFNKLAPELSDVLEALISTQTPVQLHSLLECSIRLNDFHEEILQLLASFSALLNSDEDLAGLYLSGSSGRSIGDHEHAEMLLEALQNTV
jgi:hypothetical protein